MANIISISMNGYMAKIICHRGDKMVPRSSTATL